MLLCLSPSIFVLCILVFSFGYHYLDLICLIFGFWISASGLGFVCLFWTDHLFFCTCEFAYDQKIHKLNLFCLLCLHVGPTLLGVWHSPYNMEQSSVCPSRSCSGHWGLMGWLYYSTTMAVWWSKKKVASGEITRTGNYMTLYLPQVLLPLDTTPLIYIPPLFLFLYSSLCAPEWCDSREQTMSGYPGNLGRRTEVSWAGSVPPLGATRNPLMIHQPVWWRLVTPIWVRQEEEERERKADNKEEGMVMPTSVALANRQMSLSMTQVNHVSWGKEKKK